MKILSTLLLSLMLAASAQAADRLDLSGSWRFALDPQDHGPPSTWQAQIQLPGILNAQGFGEPISTTTPWVLSLYDKNWALRDEYKAFTQPGQVKVPFLAQPPRHYLGAAWYAREVEVPASWRGKRISLFMERPHWGSTVWLDGRKLGERNSLVAEHTYELGMLAPGRHQLAVRVDNRMLLPYRPDAHSVSDSLGMSWNGIVGKLELRASTPVYLDDAQVYPDVATRTVVLRVKIGNASGRAGQGQITANGQRLAVRWSAEGGTAELRLRFPAATPLWDEWHPALQQIQLRLQGVGADDARTLSFGFVEVKARGNDILVNGRSVFLRGTHHGGDFPLTGYPPTDVAYWKRIFSINKEWGINHIRFHSFTPPEAAFHAADEVGIYLQPEPGMWNEVSPGTPMEAMLYAETEALIRAYGNHPSFLLLSPSNEPKGKWKAAFDTWIAHYRVADPRRLYSNGTGHTEPVVPELDQGTDFLAVQRIGPKPLRNVKGWFGRDYAESMAGIQVPVLGHETGQWVAYPDFRVIEKFTGYLQPGNYEIFRASARANGVLEKNAEFAYASGRFQLACYKEEIEAVLRTPGMAGYQLLDLHDYLGQGTALVGILDPFWEPKSYATAAEFRRYNAETVPLARLSRNTLTTADTLDVPVEVAHYGQAALTAVQASWQVLDSQGRALAGGQFAPRDLAIGRGQVLGRIVQPLAALPAPAAYRLVVRLDGRQIENDWPFWLYPAKVETAVPQGVRLTQSWPEAQAWLAEGARVLYQPRKADIAWDGAPLDTVPVFWNRLMNPAWTRMLGLWIDARHPALAGFPTAGFMEWQWTELVRGARSLPLAGLPAALQPIVQPIDDWNRNHKLGMLFEARVGQGRLLVSSIDISSQLDERIVARQLRRSLLDYMASDAFAPTAMLSPAQLQTMLFDTRVMKKLGATAEGAGAGAIDGDPNTNWQVPGRPDLVIRFAAPVPFNGLLLMPRQNHRDHEGDVRDYLVSVSDDGQQWREVQRGSLVSGFALQTIRFADEVKAQYLKFTPLSGFGNDKLTALAELAVLYTGPALPETEGEVRYQRARSAAADVDEAGMVEDKRKR
ncbi:discoidin domain-containing protein [Massilia sp. TS11]|uniref:discoidin domain-containing protein n=1 Tax=Massilia sp. TS11 TaxID=2908003 RepID=UPI001EDC41A5|nr:discoidin domain-containing protein [Massilia sp. TS11]MCG2583953.1 discoidin domain-containing protein [Massilia sp. TS11]